MQGDLVVKAQVTVPIRPCFLLFDIQQRPAGADDLLFIGQSLLRVFTGEKVRIRFTDELGRLTQTKLIGMGAVRPKKTTGRILEVNGVGKVVHQSRRQCLFFAQRFLRLLAFGDVADNRLKHRFAIQFHVH